MTEEQEIGQADEEKTKIEEENSDSFSKNATSEKPEKKRGSDENVIFIGQKPFMNYVTAVVTQFQTKKQTEVTVKARGKFISRAVDVSEVAAKRFLKEENIKVKDIKINSEEFENKEGRRVNVSTIDITLEKTAK